ncbi:MAG: FAD binding domain-containing protein [Ignavibacteriota bacterium]|nr:FAD binding domain-containing protein [Ignavibacteriota bacterium]
MKPADINKIYLKPSSLKDAYDYASEYKKSFRYVAGGTDVFANRFQGNDNSDCFIDLSGIEELKGFENVKDYFRIGALNTLNEVIGNKHINKEYNVLTEAAKMVASPLIRYRATLGGNLLCENRCYYYNQSDWWRDSAGYCLKCEGNICIATGSKKACYSEFVSDTAPALISLNAEVEVCESGEMKRYKLEDIYTCEGVNPRRLKNSDIIVSILIPSGLVFKSVYRKLRQRKSLEFTSLSSAVTINKNNFLKISLSGVDSGPVTYEGNTGSNSEEIIKYFLKISRSVENDMYSREYRREMIKVYISKSLKELGLS